MLEGRHAAVAREIAAQVDVGRARQLWAEVFPHLPPLESDEAIEAMLHHARTQMSSIGFGPRAYSHAWLTERALPSGLPDDMRPRAERVYPVTKPAVGYASSSKFVEVRERVTLKVNEAILEAEADGRLSDSSHVYGKMMEARSKEHKALYGFRGPMVGYKG